MINLTVKIRLLEVDMNRAVSTYRLSWSIFFLATCIFALPAIAESQVILNDAVLGPSLFPGTDANFRLAISNQQQGGLLSFEFTEQGNGDVSVQFAGIAELIAIFEIGFMEDFDFEFTQNNIPLSINNNTFNNGIFNVMEGDSVFLAYFDDLAPVPTDSNFGWAEITRTNGQLEIVGSATAVGGGIVVGTAVQLPEPSSFLSLTILATGCLARRRRAE